MVVSSVDTNIKQYNKSFYDRINYLKVVQATFQLDEELVLGSRLGFPQHRQVSRMDPKLKIRL